MVEEMILLLNISGLKWWDTSCLITTNLHLFETLKVFMALYDHVFISWLAENVPVSIGISTSFDHVRTSHEDKTWHGVGKACIVLTRIVRQTCTYVSVIWSAFWSFMDLCFMAFLQGLMFGYATDETEECMPLTIMLAHKLNAKMAELRRSGVLPWLRPDSKTQVS